MATVLRKNATPNTAPGNKPAVSSMVLIHRLPLWRALKPPLTYPPTKDVRA